MIDENPDRAREFAGVYKFVLERRRGPNVHRRPDR